MILWSRRQRIKDRAVKAMFGAKLVTNHWRGLLAEAIVAEAILPLWKWCAADWASHDFERDGISLEVRQSAARQTWTGDGELNTGQFSVASKQGYYVGNKWVERSNWRPDIYVFAWHGVGDKDRADHRDPSQWEFWVLAGRRFEPGHKTISLSAVKGKAQDNPSVRLANLLNAVDTCRQSLST